MAWTTQKTWVAAEIVDEAEMNAFIRDNMNYLNDERIKWAQRTTNTAAFSSSETDILTAPAYTPIAANRLIRAHVHVRSLNFSVVNDVFVFRIKEGTTQLQEISITANVSGLGAHGFTMTALLPNASAAAHTYKVTGGRVSGTGTVVVEAAATYPMVLTVEDVGAA
jgi:hypothetical protein